MDRQITPKKKFWKTNFKSDLANKFHTFFSYFILENGGSISEILKNHLSSSSKPGRRKSKNRFLEIFF
ncbi:hypothetical protein DLM75_18735 [Leptospira stimsonii]|uniref:Uncharacterized protein n=1 Tax=Leptospira stimsonii TaxID=2202203 RepID=A0A396YWQ6_9LEPT|nr:hypothetical protein DLM75_18735 [Leptospira stimsonii]